MKKLLAILVLGLFLHGCGTPSAYHSAGIHKASVITWDGGYGYLSSQLTLEFAIMGAFKQCIGFNNPTDCYLEYVDNRYATALEQKQWKEKFFKNEHNFEYIMTSGYITDVKKKETKKIAKKTTQETTKKKKKEEKSTGGSGSAFFVSNTGYLITNYHVIETCSSNSKIYYKNKELDAELIAKDQYLDLALLQAETKNNKFISISNKPPRKLQRIIAAGYPFGKYLSDDMKFTSGIVSSLKGYADDSTRLQIDAALNPGNSGGPIVDERTGELVAVAVAGLRKDVTEAVNFGIKAGSVKNFLESNQIETTTFTKKYNSGNIAQLLENSVVYTFCN
jgi:S1-C subfamily serine protease